MSSLKAAWKENKKILLIFLITALVIRISFSFYFQKFYFGELTFELNDTESYLRPILNLIEYGRYQGDLFLDDSKYFRMPLYPTFLGFIYTIAGREYFDFHVALIQCLMDSVSVLLVYLVILKVSNSKSSAIISSLFYSAYPFVILWVPIIYTEIVQIFLMWSLILIVVYSSPSNFFSLIIQGALCGLMILTKQYLGLILLIPILNILINKQYSRKIFSLLLVASGLSFTLSPWVIRNYMQSGEIIILRGETTGLRDTSNDFESFYKFASLFDENVSPALSDVALKGEMTFNKHPIFVDNNRIEIDRAVKLAHDCGESFVQRRTRIPETQAPYVGCKNRVAFAFDTLTDKFWEQTKHIEAFETRFDAIGKILKKSRVANQDLAISNSETMKGLLFKYRALMLMLGFIGIGVLLWRKENNFALPVLLTGLIMYFYFTVVIVHAEMRYLLIPDILISIFSGISLNEMRIYFKKIVGTNGGNNIIFY